ncbi:MAG: sulfite exporter TauE/SafE family protein [Cyclobacteriaceae bacterium]
MLIFGYTASVFIGLILGLLGGGGSILAIPILVYLFHLDPVIATAYSLFIVGSTSSVGVAWKVKKGLINFRTGLVFGAPSLLAVFITRKWIVPSLPEIIIDTSYLIITKRILLLGLFAVLMILTSFSMMKKQKRIKEPSEFSVVYVLLLGAIIGLLTGLVGAGGGFLIIPALVLLTGLPMKVATGTSLFIIAFNSLFGFTGDIFNLEIHWSFLLSITALAIGGTLIGNWLSNKIKASHLRKGFGWFTLAMGCWILIEEIIL